MKTIPLLALLFSAGWLSGCSFEPQVRARAAFDLQCPAEQVTVQQIANASFGARGCGRQGTYVITPNGQVVLNSQVDSVGPAANITGSVKPAQ